MGNLKGYGVAAAAAICATTLSTTKTAFITMVDKCVTAHTAYVNELVIVGKVNRFVHCDRYTYCCQAVVIERYFELRAAQRDDNNWIN